MSRYDDAAARAQEGDVAGALAAIDEFLAQSPRDLPALALKAELLEACGDAGAAGAYWKALASVAPPDAQLSAAMHALVARARSKVEALAAQLGGTLESMLSSVSARAASPRFARSLDILLGRREVFVQQPRAYYFPELPQVQFFDDRGPFPWLAELEAQTATIREELLGVLADRAAFEPYVKRHRERPHVSLGGLLESSDWTAFYLWKNGAPVAENAARCPRTMRAIENIPLPRLSGCSPSVMFSQLRPGAHIPPHTGIINTRLIGHLPLIVPPDCAFRVGNESREWSEARCWLFDDSIEHEAWNRSSQTRVVLIFDVWRPELSAAERGAVAALFDAIARTRGPGIDWGVQ